MHQMRVLAQGETTSTEEIEQPQAFDRVLPDDDYDEALYDSEGKVIVYSRFDNDTGKDRYFDKNGNEIDEKTYNEICDDFLKK